MKRTLWGIMLLVILALPVAAHAIPDLDASGSIAITMRYKGDPVPGGELTLYRVGDVHEENGDYYFVLSQDFLESGVDLENVQQSKTAKELSNFAGKKKLSGQTETINKKGMVTFEKLEPALYLVVQRRAAQGYYKVNPFLVSLPMLESGVYSYHVDASPKVSPVPKPDDVESPQTGQPIWPIWAFVCSAVALAALSAWKKRTEHD